MIVLGIYQRWDYQCMKSYYTKIENSGLCPPEHGNVGLNLTFLDVITYIVRNVVMEYNSRSHAVYVCCLSLIIIDM